MGKPQSEIELLKEISAKISKLSAIIAAESKDEPIKIKIYKKAGMKSEEIGSLLGKTGSAIRHRNAEKRKKGGQNSK
ncbi:MAG: hypothetical protein KGH57_00895 [Candidatus Micrarchaeota archaeon]|nr:hypothetical protein [Candidatus Micrarchaeota archaeon]